MIRVFIIFAIIYAAMALILIADSPDRKQNFVDCVEDTDDVANCYSEFIK